MPASIVGIAGWPFGRPDHAAISKLQTSRQDLAVNTAHMNDRPCRTTAGGNGASTRGNSANRLRVGGEGCPELTVMRAKQSILSLVYTGGEVRRPPLVGMQFLHERAMRSTDFVAPRPRLQAKDLIGLLVRHFAARRRAALPPCRISLRVLTPGGKPAVQIAFK